LAQKNAAREIDLNELEDAVATAAASALAEKAGVTVEVVPGLPQMLTPQMYLSGAEISTSYAFGKVVPCVSFFVVGASGQFRERFQFNSEWVVVALENVWKKHFPNAVCRLGDWDSNAAQMKRLPATLNLRFIRYSVFCYSEGKPERAGHFDILYMPLSPDF
jgi:hypothetical protein